MTSSWLPSVARYLVVASELWVAAISLGVADLGWSSLGFKRLSATLSSCATYSAAVLATSVFGNSSMRAESSFLYASFPSNPPMASALASANCGVSGLRGWWNRLIKMGIIEGYANEGMQKFKVKNDKLIYVLNIENAKRVKEEILKGAYTRGEPEMKHLWIR